MPPRVLDEREQLALAKIREQSAIAATGQAGQLAAMQAARKIGLSYDLIGAAAGVTPQTAANRLAAAQKKDPTS